MDYDPQHPPIDWSALQEMREMGADGELIALFLEEAPSQVDMMRSALTQSDSARLRAASHSLKSTSSYIGAKGMAVLCAELEKRGREKTWDNVETMLTQLGDELTRVTAELQKGYQGG